MSKKIVNQEFRLKNIDEIRNYLIEETNQNELMNENIKKFLEFWTILITRLLQFFFFFYLGFLSRTFTIHGTAGAGGGYLFNPSLPLPPASQTLRH